MTKKTRPIPPEFGGWFNTKLTSYEDVLQWKILKPTLSTQTMDEADEVNDIYTTVVGHSSQVIRIMKIHRKAG